MAPRKKLDQNAQKFIEGVPTGDRTAGDLGDLLQPSGENETRIRFTVDLNTALHDRLTIAAFKARKTKSQLAREILDRVLPM